ncbi:protein VTE6, chloroplastic isoform X2 [Gastrolobium bilobum]|uniref:protein VTE6, chloroplastic isoform X2 n=1 Tax=Gastrolobium bilobum TaxID=150636 RepID=UPI002AAFCE4C|nr:protein VTE6, chloroplastic isoform X2 [Gastrolobium bilobum]
MAYSYSTLHTITFPSSPFPFQRTLTPSSLFPKPAISIINPRLLLRSDHHNRLQNMQVSRVTSVQDAVGGAMALFQSSPATWQSSLLSNLLIFLLGSPILVTGLSLSGIAAAFLLGTLTWRAFGPSGFLLVATYFIIGTAATKVKMAQKVAQGVAEKRRGRRGPGSVIGSSAAGCVCAFLAIFGVGGEAFSQLWRLGFVASFCTKLSDTVSSEIGKAYGKTTYLVTTFKVVPRGTEGAVSVEGTLAGILASIVLAFVGCLMGELNNDAVNIINISLGSIIAVLMQQALQSWHL